MLTKKWVSIVPVIGIYIMFGFSHLWAQVQIAPTALYMGDQQKTERFIIHNASNRPQEIHIELLFGYPTPDEQGKVFLQTFPLVPEGAPDASGWIRIYPRHLVLPAGEQQVVRLSARPPAQLKAGEYWARTAVSVSDVVPNTATTTNGVASRINLIKRTLLPLSYRHQKVRTGLAIEDIRTEIAGDTLHLWADLFRQGNAAFLGDVQVSLSRNGLEVRSWQQQVAVYHSQERRFTINLAGLSPGTYEVQLKFETTGRANRQAGVLPAHPVLKSSTIIL